MRRVLVFWKFDPFQSLLGDLFQIRDTAELDFGIHRIMGQKRTVIEEFIDREVFLNDQSLLRHPNARSLDPVFKRRMFNELD